MAIFTKDFVQRYITAARAQGIYECIASAINTYWTQYGNFRHIHSARTDASIIHDLMVQNIKGKFQNDPEVHCDFFRNLFFMSINNGAVIVRFKKMDKKLRTHNNPTQQSFAFNHQLTLFGPSINVNAGYHLNGMDFSVFITCPKTDETNYWVWELSPAIPATTGMVYAMPTPSTSHSTSTRRPMAKGKEETVYGSEF